MQGTGPVKLNLATVYGYYRVDAGTLRLRLSCDEWDGLGLNAGQRVKIALPNADPQDLLILSAARTPPFVWLEMRS
ncbi:MAG: hypothetical protein JWO38_1097 [Gemmataceae bacterium]|nr:hypothetical protein [Gemmataceae bacterium]